MHQRRVVPLHVVRFVPESAQQRVEFISVDPRQHRGVGNLVAVEVQDRQHGAVAHRVDELVRVPRGRERTGLRLTVADHGCDDQLGVVERGAIGMRKCVTEFPALMDRPRCLGRHVAGNTAGEGELGEQPLHAGLVLGDVRVDLAVRPLQPGCRDRAGTSVPRTHHVHHVQVPRRDRAVQVGIDEVQPGGCSPVAEQPGLDVLGQQRLPQQRVVHQVDLTHRQVVRRAPPGIDVGEFLRVQGPGIQGRRGSRGVPIRAGHDECPLDRSCRIRREGQAFVVASCGSPVSAGASTARGRRRRFSSRAFTATIRLDPDIEIAAISGLSISPNAG